VHAFAFAFRHLAPFMVLLLPLLLGACVADPPAGPATPQHAREKDDPLPSLLRMAEGALAAGRAEAALAILERAEAMGGDDPRVLRLQAVALLAAGRPAAAADRWRALLRTSPGTWAEHLGYVRSLVASGQARLAMDHLESVKGRFATLPAWWNALGIARVHAGDAKGAVAAFDEALVRQPDHPAYTSNLALALALSGQPQRAREILRPLAEGLNSRPVFRHNLALVEVLAGRPEAARRILRIDLPDSDVDRDLARLLAMADRRSEDPPPAELAQAPSSEGLSPSQGPRGQPSDSASQPALRQTAKAGPALAMRELGEESAVRSGNGHARANNADIPAGDPSTPREAAGAPHPHGFTSPAGGAAGAGNAGEATDAPSAVSDASGAIRHMVREATAQAPGGAADARVPASGVSVQPGEMPRAEALRSAGAAPAGVPAAPVPVAPRPAVPLTTPELRPPVEALALDPADLARGRLPLGAWVMRLGMAPDGAAARRRFAELAQRFPQELGDLHRLADPDPGPQPLLAGPLPSREEAEKRCARLRAAGMPCTALRL